MARPSEPASFYMDANCWCRWATGAPEAPVIQTWLDAAHKGDAVLFASVFMLTEARGGGRMDPNPAAEQKILNVLENPNMVRLVNANRRLCKEARIIALATKAKNWDAIHLASAVTAKAEVYLTYNTRDFPMGSLHDGVWVDKPYRYGQPTLFTP